MGQYGRPPQALAGLLVIGAQSVEIHQETRELWSKIKWHVFMAYGVYLCTVVVVVVAAAARTLTYDLKFQSHATYDHDPCTRKNLGQRSADSKDIMESNSHANKRTDGRTRPIALTEKKYQQTDRGLPFSKSLSRNLCSPD